MGRPQWLIFAILCGALYLRLVSIRFGLPALNDPDEIMFEMGALRMLRGPTLDPGWFGHPATTTMYVLALTNAAVFAGAWLFGRVDSVREFADLVYADPSWMILPGRIVMTGFALFTIYLTWQLARRFFGDVPALVAALLLAFNPVHVTYSQIIRSDMMACMFMLLCLRAAIGIADRARWRDYLAAAAWLGLAIATKWPFGLSGIAIIVATVVAVRGNVVPRRIGATRLLASGPAAIGVLFLVSPYLIIDHMTVVANLQGESQTHHLGATGGGFWNNLAWYAAGPIYRGFGPVGIVLIVVGAAAAAVRHRLAAAMLGSIALAFVVLLCAQQLVWERWSLPLMPLGAIVAGAGSGRIMIYLAGHLSSKRAGAIAIAGLVAALLPLGADIYVDNRVRLNDTRQIASRWAERHLPADSVVLVEHFAFDLLKTPWRFIFPMGDAGCVDVQDFLHKKASYSPIETARGDRSNVDYGTVAPSRRAKCRMDFAILTQSERYHAERDRFPLEDAAYRSLIASGRVIATVRPQPGRIGGPVVTIVAMPKGIVP